MLTNVKFSLGRVVATPGALLALAEADQSPPHFLVLHASGAWGEVCAADRRSNDEAVSHEDDPERRGRVLSSYRTGTGVRIWVVRRPLWIFRPRRGRSSGHAGRPRSSSARSLARLTGW